MKIICSWCKKELDKPGALLFGPPIKPPICNVLGDWSEKFHICCECFEKIIYKMNKERVYEQHELAKEDSEFGGCGGTNLTKKKI